MCNTSGRGNTLPERVEAVWRGYEDFVTGLAGQGARIGGAAGEDRRSRAEEAARRQAQLASLARRAGV